MTSEPLNQYTDICKAGEDSPGVPQCLWCQDESCEKLCVACQAVWQGYEATEPLFQVTQSLVSR